MLQSKAKVLENKELSPGIYLLVLEAPGTAKQAKPGQFIHLRLGTTYDPLLRRPMSIFNVQGNNLFILYQVIGRGTKLMTEFISEDTVDLLGPLGRGFKLLKEKRQVLVGGGVGAAPLVYLARKLIQVSTQVDFFLGMRKDELMFISDYLPPKVNFFTAHEELEGKASQRVTEILASNLEPTQPTAIYCCGPEKMYEEMGRITESNPRFQMQVSLSKRMGCGVGTCLSCVTPIKQPGRQEAKNARTCVEGPVFFWQEVEVDGD